MNMIAKMSFLLVFANLFATGAPEGEPITIAQSYTFESQVLGQQRRINVYLPPGSPEDGKTYPVLFLLDGGVKEDFVHIAGLASLAADFRKIRPFIVVGIEGIDRYHELTHPSQDKRDLKNLPTSGGSAKFRAFIGKELMPWVEKHFPINDERVLMGESAAGLFVTETMLREPQLFGAYIAISPSLWWNQQSLVKQAPEWFKDKDKFKKRRLFLTIADEGGDMQGGVDKLVAAIKEHAPESFKMTYIPMYHESHGTIYHPAALKAIRNIFAM